MHAFVEEAWMKEKRARRVLAALALGLLAAGPTAAQEPSNEELRKDIQALQESLKAIQKDLQDIKGMLARPAGPPPLVNKVIDLGNGPFKGEAEARVTLVEISDYQCPFCSRYTRDTYPQVENEYIKTGKVKSVFLDLPLESLHNAAFGAAKAARCAGDQGKYWEMHDRLFANQKTLEPWNPHAEAIGLDVAVFETCVGGTKHDDAIRRDMAEAQKLGITGTPAFLIGRTDPKSSKLTVAAALRGARPFADFKTEIDKLLAEPEKARVVAEPAKK
jgi:protein-disulfide isomerase